MHTNPAPFSPHNIIERSTTFKSDILLLTVENQGLQEGIVTTALAEIE